MSKLSGNKPGLISGKIKRILPNGDIDFISVDEAEKYLGLPPGPDYVLTSDVNGNRSW